MRMNVRSIGRTHAEGPAPHGFLNSPGESLQCKIGWAMSTTRRGANPHPTKIKEGLEKAMVEERNQTLPGISCLQVTWIKGAALRGRLCPPHLPFQ